MARILIVDDDRQFRRIVRLALTVNGHEASEAANGAEAVIRLRESVFDLVFLDWQMPVMGGEETCHAIRAFTDVPIIVVSARDRSSDALLSGATASLTKPLDLEALLFSIQFRVQTREPDLKKSISLSLFGPNAPGFTLLPLVTERALILRRRSCIKRLFWAIRRQAKRMYAIERNSTA